MFGFEERDKFGLGRLLRKYISEQNKTFPSGSEDGFTCDVYLMTAKVVEWMGSRPQCLAGGDLRFTHKFVLLHGQWYTVVLEHKGTGNV